MNDLRILFASIVALVLSLPMLPEQGVHDPRPAAPALSERAVDRLSDRGLRAGRRAFRYETFGDEQLWTDVLRMQEVVATLDPATALEVGLKVDADALPAEVIAALGRGEVDLKDPAVTLALLKLDAVVGVRGRVNRKDELVSVGITCALCHSSVDDSLAPGVGRRLDGWANPDLDVGTIVSLSPALDDATRAELRTWGPGQYDPRHHAFDGVNLIPLNSPSVPIVIPPIYGLQRVGFETYTADGPISYWNGYVGVGQMGGHGSFVDPRIGLSIVQTPDRVTPLLPALLDYQLSLHAPAPPDGSFDPAAARRGQRLFRHEARCNTCHRGSTFTDVGDDASAGAPVLHDAAETGADPRYAERSATGKYRTTPLRALWQHAPYFHDGSAADLRAVVDRYDRQLELKLSDAEKNDLVEYLKSL